MAFNLNRYDQPAQAQFIQTYTPIPFEELLAAGKAKQDRYDKASAATDAVISKAEMINAIPDSIDDARRNKMISDLYSIRDKYIHKDLSDPFVQRDLSHEIRSKVDPVLVKKMEESYNTWNKAQEAKRMLAMNNRWNPDLDDDPASVWDSSTMGVYNYSPRAFLSESEVFEKYYRNIKPEEGEWMDPNSRREYLKKEVKESKIRKVTDDIAAQLLKNPEVYDHVRLYKQQHPEVDDLTALKTVMNRYAVPTFVSSDLTPLPKLDDGPNNSNNFPIPLDLKNLYGQDKDSNKPLSYKQVQKEVSDLMGKASKGDVASSNLVKQWNNIENTIRDEHEREVYPVLKDKIADLYESTAQRLSSLGVSNEEISKILDVDNVSNAANLANKVVVGQGVKDLMRFVANASIKPERMLEDVSLGVSGTIDVIRGGLNKDTASINRGIEKLHQVKKDSIFRLKPNETKSKVLSDFYNGLKDINEYYKTKNDELVSNITSSFNRLNSNQDTYTILNFSNVYKGDVLKGTWINNEGTEKNYNSAIAGYVTDAILGGSPNYQIEVFDDKGKLDRMKISELRRELKNSDGFIISRIDDEPDDKGNPIVTFQKTKVAKDGKKEAYGKEYKIHLPMHLDEARTAVSRDLNFLGLDRLSYRFLMYPSIKNYINSSDLYDENTRIPLPVTSATNEDYIYFIQSGNGLVPVMHYNGVDRPMSENGNPVNVQSLPNVITEYLYNLETLITNWNNRN